MKCYLPKKIISGGQTGVDRAGLDAALACGIAIGGYMPKGAKAEDGRVPSLYKLSEADTRSYSTRTELNVLESDATLILCNKKPAGGTLLTQKLCRIHMKPVLVLDVTAAANLFPVIRGFLNSARPRVLNIAGPRESKAPGIHYAAYTLLCAFFNTCVRPG